MTNQRVLLAAVVSIAILGLVPAAADAQTDACAPFTVHSGDERSVVYLDHGLEGPGSGDLRIGRRSLVDEDGNDAGYHRWVLMHFDLVNPEETDLNEYYGTHVLNLKGGDVYYQVLGEVAGQPHETGKPSVKDYTGVVVGGTGAYAFARGTVDRTFDGTKGSYALDIRCD